MDHDSDLDFCILVNSSHPEYHRCTTAGTITSSRSTQRTRQCHFLDKIAATIDDRLDKKTVLLNGDSKLEGSTDGVCEGLKDGLCVGYKDGLLVGSKDGILVGSTDGLIVGYGDGFLEW